jgi:hypothetical protein
MFNGTKETLANQSGKKEASRGKDQMVLRIKEKFVKNSYRCKKYS